MNNSGNNSITTGDISGTGIAVGHGATATVTISRVGRDQIAELLVQLRKEILASSLPDGAKGVLINKAVPEMEQAIKAEDPKPGIGRGLERINDQLEGVGSAAEKVSGIIETVKKIAQTAGFVVKTVVPFIGALL